ncbi:MAG: cob(I)yrinic acid a,c-diamide adenosyltransferase [Alphaproteobacteria bacterium]|nr:cob(I)yrinic acid a,c-diamide adenosyltransferase [Alphaproteobacteria bacterium]
MVTINKVYTRTGDAGTTALGTGERLSKDSVRVEAYGSVDELNAVLGLARLETDGALGDTLGRIQNDLFDLGGDLCIPEGTKLDFEPLRVTEGQVSWLESEIDRLNADLAPLTSFILPGGSRASALLHHARTVARRAERRMVTLAAGESVGAPALKYINRLSDFLFVAARHANRASGDVLWVPGAGRKG